MKLQKFNAGLNTREASHLIKINEAIEYENIDNEKGHLLPINSPVAANQVYTQNDRYIKHLNAVTTLDKTPTSLVEFSNKIYYSVNSVNPDAEELWLIDSVSPGQINSVDTTAPSVIPTVSAPLKYRIIDSGNNLVQSGFTCTGTALTGGVPDNRIFTGLDVTGISPGDIFVLTVQENITSVTTGGFPQVKDSNQEGDLGLFHPKIVPLQKTIVKPPTPVIGDITITDYSVYPTFSPVGWNGGETYDFAVVRIADDGTPSDVFQFTHTFGDYGGTASVPVNGDKRWLRLELPWKYKIYHKIGKVWKNIAGGSSAWIATLPAGFKWNSANAEIRPIGEANSFIDLGITNFTSEGSIWVPNWVNYPVLPGVSVNEDNEFERVVTVVDIAAITVNNQDLPTDTYTYITTVSVVSLGWESKPSNPVSIDITGGEKANLQIFELADEVLAKYPTIVADSRIDRVSIYRVGGGFTEFVRIVQIDNPTFPIEYNDQIVETTLTAINTTDGYDKPPTGLTNLHMVGTQLCGTKGTKLHFSLAGKLHAMPAINFRDFRETLTSLFNIDAGLIICSADSTWLLNTSNLETGKTIKLSEQFGCVNHKTMAAYKTGAIWASSKGICVSFGGKVELVSKEQLGYIDLQITNAIMYNETYYGFATQGKCYALDMRYGGIIIKVYDFLTFIDSDPTTIVRQIYEENDTLKLLFGTTTATDSYSLFSSTEVETFKWTSPKFLEGSYTEIKTYKDIYIRATANITVEVYIDDERVCKEVFYKTDTHNLKLPQIEHQGYSLQFKAYGKGKIFEIEYKAIGRQNGR